MRKYQKPLLIPGLLVLITIVAVALYKRNNAPLAIDAVQVNTGKAQQVLAVVGRVRTKNVVDVRVEYPGAIIAMPVDEGSEVKRGEIIAQVRSAEEQAALAVTEADLRALEAELKLAQQERDRVEVLAEKGWVAQSALDQARTDLSAAKARRRAAQAVRTQAGIRVGDFVVRSPLDGVVLTRPVDPGQVVGLTDVIFQIGSKGAVEIEAEVDEVYAGELAVGMPAILAPTGKKQRSEGRITEISPRVDPLTGSRLTRLMLNEPNTNFVPGRSIDVNILVETFDDALSLARSALRKEGNIWFAYTIANGQIEARRVTFLDWPGSSVVLHTGLTPGALVARDSARAAAAMAAGRRVSVQQAPP